jgi:hypothetical protein
VFDFSLLAAGSLTGHGLRRSFVGGKVRRDFFFTSSPVLLACRLHHFVLTGLVMMIFGPLQKAHLVENQIRNYAFVSLYAVSHKNKVTHGQHPSLEPARRPSHA